MRLGHALFAAALAACLAAPAAAEPYALDPEHSQVTFTVDHIGFSIIHGQFRDFDAVIDFDPENVEGSSVGFVIRAASIDTSSAVRDRAALSKAVLDAEEHPEITFVSRHVDLTSAETADVTGDLTIRGVTHEEVFQVRLNRMGPSPFNPSQTVAGFTVTSEIDRTRYGASFAAPAVGAIVPIRLDLEASPQG